MAIETRADVIVIGGGITGCATAYELAKHGRKVALFEKGAVASEASGQSAAIVRLQGRHPSELPMMLDCIAQWEGLDDELSAGADFVRNGNLYLAVTEQERRRFEYFTGLAQSQGLDSRMMTPAEVYDIVPALSRSYPFLAGMYSPRDGYASPTGTTRAFARAAREHGAFVYEQTPAFRILHRDGRVRGVETTGGTCSAPVVVNAAGVWAGRLARQVGVTLPIRIISLTNYDSEPAPPTFRPLVRSRHLTARPLADGRLRLAEGFDRRVNYEVSLDLFNNLRVWRRSLMMFRREARFRIWRERLRWDLRALLAPATPAAFPARTAPPPDPRVRRRALAGLALLFPQLRGLRAERLVTGMLDLLPDMRPAIGAAGPDGYFIAAGFSGHGFAMGPVVGRIMADLVISGSSPYDLRPFDPLRFARGPVDAPISWL
ncbi:MAG: FAD-binding oxidoreductase [Dehalococcoidia bacterium]